MPIYFLEKMKSDRETYCARQALLFYELKTQGKPPDVADIFRYNFFCKNTRKT